MRLPLFLIASVAVILSANTTYAAGLTPKQEQSVAELVTGIKRLSRIAFDRESWEAFAVLYNESALDCTPAWKTSGPYSYLSIPPIPESARYHVGPIAQFHLGNGDFSRMGATHYLEISYDRAWLAACGKPADRIFPRHHFFLRPHGEGFELTHGCPGLDESLPRDFPAAPPPMVSALWAVNFVDQLRAGERQKLRQTIIDAKVKLHGMFAMQDHYRISEDQAVVAIERLCELEGPSE